MSLSQNTLKQLNWTDAHAMTNEKKAIDDVRTMLRSLVSKSFPKHCRCGKTYATVDQFLTETEESNYPTNILQVIGYTDASLAALCRDCSCGATLIVIINDRRDFSKDGIRIREEFGDILRVCEASGMKPHIARKELLTILQGGTSDILAKEHIDRVIQLRDEWQEAHLQADNVKEEANSEDLPPKPVSPPDGK